MEELISNVYAVIGLFAGLGLWLGSTIYDALHHQKRGALKNKDYLKIALITAITLLVYVETYRIAQADLIDFKLLSTFSGMVFSYLFKAIIDEMRRKGDKDKD